MLLTIDISNKDTTLATFIGEKIRRIYRVTTKTPRTTDEYGVLFMDIIRLSHAKMEDVKGIIIASVVPSVMYPVTNACRRYFHVKPLVVGPGVRTGVKVKANNPRETGADLIVNCAAAVELYGGPAIIVDYGTATSFTLMLEDGTLDAVIIAPGIQTSLTSLSKEASLITDVEIRKPKHALPHETSECIQAGIVYSTIGSTEYIVHRMKEASGLENVKVIATGGFGKMFAKEIADIDIFDALLPQQGLRIIYEKNSER